MFTYQIKVEYLGTNFVGWQIQKNGLSVQEVLEKALFKFWLFVKSFVIMRLPSIVDKLSIWLLTKDKLLSTVNWLAVTWLNVTIAVLLTSWPIEKTAWTGEVKFISVLFGDIVKPVPATNFIGSLRVNLAI